MEHWRWTMHLTQRSAWHDPWSYLLIISGGCYLFMSARSLLFNSTLLPNLKLQISFFHLLTGQTHRHIQHFTLNCNPRNANFNSYIIESPNQCDRTALALCVNNNSVKHFRYWLTQWSRVLSEMLIGLLEVKIFPKVYGIWKFVTTFTSKATCPYSEPDQSSPCLPILHFEGSI